MLGDFAGPKLGSLSDNVVHTYTLPLALGAFGFWGEVRPALLIGLVWVGHIGADRVVGYGLKFESGSRIRTPRPNQPKLRPSQNPTNELLNSSSVSTTLSSSYSIREVMRASCLPS